VETGEGKGMRQGMSKKSSRELVESFREGYQVGSSVDKTRILDTLVESTGYVRKYLLRILHGKVPKLQDKRRRTAKYSEEFRAALVIVWEASGYICGKRLVPFIPDFILMLEMHGHLKVTARVREQLLTVSAATVDRLLRLERKRVGRGISMTKPGKLLRQQIAVRSGPWDDAVAPGFFEADLVAHCGGDSRGLYAHTLTMTDIWSGWTECTAFFGKREVAVLAAVTEVKERLPMPLLAFDSDNGSEFINEKLSRYCASNDITFTRCRPYKKNDQAHVEEKNGSVVRRFVGYARYDSKESLRLLTELYRISRLFVNYFQPSMKLLEKHRDGAKVRKKYLPAQTPYQRLLKSSLPEVKKQALRETLLGLDPVALLNKIKDLQKRLEQASNQESVSNLESVRIERLALSKKENRLASKRRENRGRRPLIDGRLKKQVESWLLTDPALTALKLTEKINSRFPGCVAENQLATVKSFLRQWRLAHPEFNASYHPRFEPDKKPKFPNKRFKKE